MGVRRCWVGVLGGFGGGACEFLKFNIFTVGLGVAFFAGLGGAVLLTSVMFAAEMALGFFELAAEIFAHCVDAALEQKRLI